jgi:protein TonB
MATGYQGLNEPRHCRRNSIWGVLGSVGFHALIVAAIILAFQERPYQPRVVVPVDAVTLVPFKTGPKGGGGGRPAPAPVTKPEAVAEKPTLHPKRRAKAKLAPPPEPPKAPEINTPAPVPVTTGTAKSPETAVASNRNSSPGISGSGQGGQGGGRGTGSYGGVGSGQGRGSGAGSALQGYLRDIRRILEEHKDYPWMARRRNIQGVVLVVFTIGCRGQIEAYRVSRTSGHDLLDDAAQDTIRRVGKFPPFPPELNRQKLTIEVPLAFRLSTE